MRSELDQQTLKYFRDALSFGSKESANYEFFDRIMAETQSTTVVVDKAFVGKWAAKFGDVVDPDMPWDTRSFFAASVLRQLLKELGIKETD